MHLRLIVSAAILPAHGARHTPNAISRSGTPTAPTAPPGFLPVRDLADLDHLVPVAAEVAPQLR